MKAAKANRQRGVCLYWERRREEAKGWRGASGFTTARTRCIIRRRKGLREVWRRAYLSNAVTVRAILGRVFVARQRWAPWTSSSSCLLVSRCLGPYGLSSPRASWPLPGRCRSRPGLTSPLVVLLDFSSGSCGLWFRDNPRRFSWPFLLISSQLGIVGGNGKSKERNRGIRWILIMGYKKKVIIIFHM